VFTNLLFELLSLLGSFGVKSVLVLVVASELLSLRSNDALEDFSGGVEVSFKLGFKDGLLVVRLGEVLVKDCDVVVASSLEFLVVSIVLLLFSDELVFKSSQCF